MRIVVRFLPCCPSSGGKDFSRADTSRIWDGRRAATLTYGFKASAQSASAKTLRFIAQSDLRVLDPVWTTAYITRNHGYMAVPVERKVVSTA